MKILGSQITGNARSSEDTRESISKAWRAFWAMKGKFCNDLVDPSIRIKALEVFIRPVLLYAAGSWTPSKSDLQALRACHLQMSRVIIGRRRCSQEPWHEYLQKVACRSRKIWKMIGVKSWDEACLLQVHRWAGHVARYAVSDPDRWPYLLLCWRDSSYIDRRRSCSSSGTTLGRGHQRPPWRWDHHIHHFYRTNSLGLRCEWREKARDKAKWPDREDAWARNRLLVATNFHM